MSIFQSQPVQLPELGSHVAPSKVVNWAKTTLEKIRALPALGQDVNILHLNVGAAMLKAWSVTYSDKPDAPGWAYPNDLDLVATTAAAKKNRLEWHVAWLEKLIKFFGASDVDALFRAIQRDVHYNTNIPTTAAVAEWTLAIAKVETTMKEVHAAADPKALYKAYLATLPSELRAYVEKHKPNDQPATWETVVKLLRSKVEAAEEHSDFLKASDFKSAFSKPGKGSGTSDPEARNSGQITADGRRWRGRGGRSHSRGRRNWGDGHDRRAANEAEKEQDGGKTGGKAGGKSRGGKAGGKAGTGKRPRDGKGATEPAAKKKAVKCYRCGEMGHYMSKCTKPEQLMITNGTAEDP